MLRFEISEHDRGALPVVDLGDDVVIIGSGANARIRLPADAVLAEHLRIEGQTWTLLAESKLGGMMRAAGDSGSIGHGLSIEIGPYRVRIGPSPAGTSATPAQRTESLARELVRSLLGEGAAPSFTVERGPTVGATRALPPPEATLVIGRGDEATWVILDEDLSRAHVEIRRGWDGVFAADLDSKNGTRVDGARIGSEAVLLSDGASLALGRVILRFRDPAERHLRGESLDTPARRRRLTASGRVPGAPRPWTLIAYAIVIAIALAALLWVLTT